MLDPINKGPNMCGLVRSSSYGWPFFLFLRGKWHVVHSFCCLKKTTHRLLARILIIREVVGKSAMVSLSWKFILTYIDPKTRNKHSQYLNNQSLNSNTFKSVKKYIQIRKQKFLSQPRSIFLGKIKVKKHINRIFLVDWNPLTPILTFFDVEHGHPMIFFYLYHFLMSLSLVF